jgi:hypothetical protein
LAESLAEELMPLVRLYKARRIWKAKRKKAKPKWQDQDPGTPEGRDAYAIAAKYEQTFAKAFLAAIREQITPEIERDFKKAWQTGSPSAVINSIPFFEENPDADVWEDFTEKLAVAYATVIQAAGDEATKDLNKQFDTDLTFYALPPEDQAEGIEIAKSMDDVRRAAAGMTVDVNPYSIKWIEDHGLELVTQGISPQQKDVVTSIIQSTMEVGGRPTAALDQIKANIGLTARDFNAANKRMALHLDSGLSVGQATELTDKYRDQLLKNRAQLIARTETIAAQAQGRKDAWLVAEEGGHLPEVIRRWLAPPPGPNPNAPCEICLDLDGTTAKLKEPYESMAGPVDGPPAHPACRCTETLERV